MKKFLLLFCISIFSMSYFSCTDSAKEDQDSNTEIKGWYFTDLKYYKNQGDYFSFSKTQQEAKSFVNEAFGINYTGNIAPFSMDRKKRLNHALFVMDVFTTLNYYNGNDTTFLLQRWSFPMNGNTINAWMDTCAQVRTGEFPEGLYTWIHFYEPRGVFFLYKH